MGVDRRSAPECKELLDDGWIYLDVRTEEEFNLGHPTGAYHIPWAFTSNHGMEPNREFLEQVKATFEADSRIVIGCEAGGRSLKAAKLLLSEGYTSIVDCRPGWGGARSMLTRRVTEPGWKACELPIAMQAEDGRSYEAIEAAFRAKQGGTS